MSVSVDKPPSAPQLSGRYADDYVLLHRFLRELSRVANQLRERSGGYSDLIANTADTAGNAANSAAASQAGADIPTSGGAIELNPASPISFISSGDATTKTIVVASHTRTGAAAPLIGANVDEAQVRGFTYYVYYADAANNGGAQTFLATTEIATVTGTAGYRIVGTIFIPAGAYKDRDFL